MTDPIANLTAYGDVNAAHQRLVDRGLASDDPAGVNQDGLTTLADLLSILTFQLGAGGVPGRTDQVAAATARAMLGALSDLFADMADQHPTGTETLQLLAAATKTARNG